MALRALPFPLLFPLLLVLTPRASAATLEALVQTPAGRPLADAAVVLEPLAPSPVPSLVPMYATAPKSRAHATIEQRGAEFIPFVTVVQTGAPVDFPGQRLRRGAGLPHCEADCGGRAGGLDGGLGGGAPFTSRFAAAWLPHPAP